jgi:hypothetical protein
VTISKAQILSALSGLIFVPAGAFVSAWTAKHMPGLPHFSAEEITGVMVAGAGAAFGVALHYLKGLREWEKLEAEGFIKVVGATREVVTPPTQVIPS